MELAPVTDQLIEGFKVLGVFLSGSILGVLVAVLSSYPFILLGIQISERFPNIASSNTLKSLGNKLGQYDKKIGLKNGLILLILILFFPTLATYIWGLFDATSFNFEWDDSTTAGYLFGVLGYAISILYQTHKSYKK
jgi:hypothetical protein